jgi:hypothetical protein
VEFTIIGQNNTKMDVKARLKEITALDLKVQKLQNLTAKAETRLESAKQYHLQLYEVERAQKELDSKYYWERSTELLQEFVRQIE